MRLAKCYLSAPSSEIRMMGDALAFIQSEEKSLTESKESIPSLDVHNQTKKFTHFNPHCVFTVGEQLVKRGKKIFKNKNKNVALRRYYED